MANFSANRHHARMERLEIWRITDTTPGHLSQTAGLIAAMERVRKVAVRDIPAWRPLQLPTQLFFPPFKQLPDASPDLILCCGHRTHLTALALRRAYGGKLIVLMKPSLPLRLFDLVVVPRHDGVRASPRVIQTEGALNPLTAAGPHHADRGVILIGGPSRHHDWRSSSIVEQVRRLVSGSPGVRWTLTTSRRTPEDSDAALRGLRLPNLEIVPFKQTPPGWVAEQLALVATAWVSEDSVSMLYEALTAGVAVGVLDVPRRGHSRINRGIDHLVTDRRVVRFTNWTPEVPLPRSEPLAEADRVAAEIIKRWFGRVEHGPVR